MTCHFLLTDTADLFQQGSFYRIDVRIREGYKLRGWKDEDKSLRKTPSSLVAVVYLRGDFLLELGELVLREGAGQDLRTPLDEVVDHVSDRVEHLALVALSGGEGGRQMNTCGC